MSARGPRPELLSFLGAIKAEPEEDTPKLALADWLQEQPDPADQARGEFLRQFVRNNQLAKNDPAREDFAALTRLWNAHEKAWAGRLRAAGLVVWATNQMFRWGLLFPALDWGGARDADVIDLAGREEYAWVAGLAVRAVDPGAVAKFAASPLLDSLVGLRVPPAAASDVLLEALCDSPRVARLQSLEIGPWSAPLRALGRSPRLTSLRHLTIQQFTTPADFRALGAAPHLNALRVLEVHGSGLTVEAARAFAEGTGLPALAELNLGWTGYRFNHLDDDGMIALVANPHSGRLRKLNLAGNDIGDSGACALCVQPHMCNLTHLNLSNNRIANRAAAELARAEHLKTLEELNLRANAITAPGALALAKSPHLANLRRLDLTENRIGDRAAKALRERFGDAVLLD